MFFKFNLITVACKPEKTYKQQCLLCEPETRGLTPTLPRQTPTLPRQLFWVLLHALPILVQGTYMFSLMTHPKDQSNYGKDFCAKTKVSQLGLKPTLR